MTDESTSNPHFRAEKDSSRTSSSVLDRMFFLQKDEIFWNQRQDNIANNSRCGMCHGNGHTEDMLHLKEMSRIKIPKIQQIITSCPKMKPWQSEGIHCMQVNRFINWGNAVSTDIGPAKKNAEGSFLAERQKQTILSAPQMYREQTFYKLEKVWNKSSEGEILGNYLKITASLLQSMGCLPNICLFQLKWHFVSLSMATW